MKRRTTRDKSRKKNNETCLLFIDVAKNDLLALKFGTNVVVVMIYLSSPRTKQTTWNWSNDRRFRRKFYIIFRVLFLPFSTYNPINFIDFASEWSNSQCIKSCDRLQILVGIDGVCSELHVVDWSILVDFGRYWRYGMWLSILNACLTSIQYGDLTYEVKNRPKSTNQPRVTRYKLHQCQPKFASDHNSWCTDCSTTQKQNRWSLSDCTSKTVKKELEK